MIKAEPIIAVKNVPQSSKWYQSLFDCNLSSGHGGDIFEILTTKDGAVLLCLHNWERDHHPTMMDSAITVGNGLILYFRTTDLLTVRQKAEQLGAKIEADIHLNENSGNEEFSIRDLDGYYLTITSYHDYGHNYQ